MQFVSRCPQNTGRITKWTTPTLQKRPPPRYNCLQVLVPHTAVTLTFKALHTGHPTHHISLISCNITNLRGLCTRPFLIGFLSSVTAYLLDLINAFRFSTPKVWNSLPVSIHESRVTSYFQASSKDILLSVSLHHFSCPPRLEYLCPRALILLRVWCHINHTYLHLGARLRFGGQLPLP